MLLRLYLPLRVLRDSTSLKLSKTTREASKLSENHRVDMAVKTSFDTRPVGSITVTLAVFTTAIAYAVRTCELGQGVDGDNNPVSFTRALWMVVVTMTTVGYGDVVPSSPLARVLTLTAALAGLVLTAIMISIVHKELALSAAQGYTIKRFLLERTDRKLEDRTASLIVTWWQMKLLDRIEEKEARAACEERDARAGQAARGQVSLASPAGAHMATVLDARDTRPPFSSTRTLLAPDAPPHRCRKGRRRNPSSSRTLSPRHLSPPRPKTTPLSPAPNPTLLLEPAFRAARKVLR